MRWRELASRDTKRVARREPSERADVWEEGSAFFATRDYK